jgi:hypothetical protein
VQTNNPRKLDVLAQLGVSISGRIPCQVQAGEFNQVRRCAVAGGCERPFFASSRFSSTYFVECGTS